MGDPPAAATSLAAFVTWAYAFPIVDASGTGVPECERLARRYFALFREGETDKMLDLMHPEVEMVLKARRPGKLLRGRDEIAAFVGEISGSFYETHAEVFRPLDDRRIVIEGRVRWMDDDRVLRDDPMIWALEFQDGLLLRSTPAGSVTEAEAILGTASRSARS